MLQAQIESVSEKITPRKLLLISCSATKRDLKDQPALQVYDGPSYRIIRKYPTDKIDILILSAKYGLIFANHKISVYEQKMNDHIAQEMKNQATDRLVSILQSSTYSEIYIELGKTYRNAIGFDNPLFKELNIKYGYGTIGVRLHNLKMWLASVTS